MISDTMLPKWLVLVNHFKMLATEYRQMAYSIQSTGNGTSDYSLRGFSECLHYEGGERWKMSDWLAECLEYAGRSVVLEAIPKPKNDFMEVKDVLTHAVNLEDQTISTINSFLKDARTTEDFYTLMKFEEVMKRCVMERQEVSHVAKKWSMYYGEPAALLYIDDKLFMKYHYEHSHNDNPKKKY